MAMARDGLLPSFFSDVNKKTQVPVKGTVVTGLCSATLAFSMNVDQLAGMVSAGLSVNNFVVLIMWRCITILVSYRSVWVHF